MRSVRGLFGFILICCFGCQVNNPDRNIEVDVVQTVVPEKKGLRIATFNASLNRNSLFELREELKSPDSKQIQLVAETIQRVRPDVLLINEIDFDETHQTIDLFQRNYLQVSQNNAEPIEYKYAYIAPVNTGIDSGEDLNNNLELGEPEDAFGFGRFPGQYGMALFSRFPIQVDDVRTFQLFLWKDMPDPLWPVNQDGSQYYSAAAKEKFRISSKSHWIVPIQVGGQKLNMVCAHPTPPVFDGPEDRNGRRNHDEIRLIVDMIDGKTYLVDDQGRRGALNEDDLFVVLGDLNSDPEDGDSLQEGILRLLKHPRVNSMKTPASEGGVAAARKVGKKNATHRGDPAFDTADFNDDVVGNLRVDYVLPSVTIPIVQSGVFWPTSSSRFDYLNQASDHRLVWIDTQISPDVE
ncbi:MAG TPA: endonuclease/exonuclease/phosphatase family protein [Pirellulaceae bacterium]|nr:endonuclease/exonuclease/phosphatase family protein [Pirellulaceae bacterium]HMP71015.1 endonuclease/exonuclease/phosphatase family protein [Pirellulaceae bacterium]